MLLADPYRAALAFAFDPAVAPAAVQLVAAGDKLYNLRTILADYRGVGEPLWERFTGGREGVLWYYSSLADTFTLENPVVRDLRAAAAELAALCGSGGARAEER